jgi:signal transduction histidine kinase
VAASKTKPLLAQQVLETIAATSRDALGQMRRMVAVLRSGRYDDVVGYNPAPGIDELGALLAQVESAGLTATFDTIGTARPMTRDAELAVFRVVQEALTNVLKHAGPDVTCRALLHYGSAEAVITVIDDGRGAAAESDGAGHGLTGMTERVGLLGGSVHAAPGQAGGFEVTATVPYGTDRPRRPDAADDGCRASGDSR